MSTIHYPQYPKTVWDKAIMVLFPFRYQLNRTGIFDDAVKFANDNFTEKTFTYKGPTFFFKNEQDYMWFILRWA